MQTPDNRRWYTAGQAAARMTQNSGKKVHPNYLHILASRGKIEHFELDATTWLYNADQVDGYVVKKQGRPATKPQTRKRKKNPLERRGGARAGAGRPKQKKSEDTAQALSA